MLFKPFKMLSVFTINHYFCQENLHIPVDPGQDCARQGQWLPASGASCTPPESPFPVRVGRWRWTWTTGRCPPRGKDNLWQRLCCWSNSKYLTAFYYRPCAGDWEQQLVSRSKRMSGMWGMRRSVMQDDVRGEGPFSDSKLSSKISNSL